MPGAPMDPEVWQRLKPLFSTLAGLPAAERRDELERVRRDEPSLYPELVSLLDAHDRGSTALRIDDELEAVPAPDHVGRRFGAYRVVRELGRGGMGAVFLAERADGAFERLAAVKVVGSRFADPEMTRRLRRERQILARLSHPNVARLLDGGVTEQGEPYFVMEYVDGVRIDEYCDTHGLSASERLRLVIAVCRAVDYAHQQRIIHRDLKPSNILVTADGMPILVDFGIARLLDDGGGSEHTLTEHRAFTPDYASPEQIRGERALAPATDIYTLGLVIARLVPAAADEASATAGETDLGRGVRDLRRVVAMACRPEPSRRYPSAGDLADDLDRVLTRRPVMARPDSLAYRASKFVERHRTAIGASVLTIAAIAAGAGVTYLWQPRASAPGSATAVTPLSGPLAPIRSVAVLPLRDATDGTDRALRLGLADAVAEALASLSTLTVRPTSATVDYLDQAADPIAFGRTLEVDAVLDGVVHRNGSERGVSLRLVQVATGAALWEQRLVGDPVQLLDGPDSLGPRVLSLLAPGHAVSPSRSQGRSTAPGHASAQDAYLQGVLAMANSVRQAPEILAARDAFERAIRLEPDFVQAKAGLATAYVLAGSLSILAPAASYPRAEEAARAVLERDPDLASAHMVLGDVAADYHWDWDAAESHYQRAIALAPRTASIHQSYAEFLARMGRFTEADEHSRLAREYDPTRVNYLALRGLFYYLEHRFADAIAESRRALERDPRTYLAHLYMSASFAAMGRPDEGLDAARQATALTGGAVPDLFVTACNHALRNDRAATQELVDRLHALGRTRYVDPFHFVAIHAYLGDTDEAFAWLERSYSERSYWMSSLRIHPAVDALRGDPRFTAMLRRMRLE